MKPDATKEELQRELLLALIDARLRDPRPSGPAWPVRLVRSLAEYFRYRAYVPACWIGAACGLKYLFGL